MTQDSGVNLSIYCCFVVFFSFWRVPVFSEWMLEKPSDDFLHSLACQWTTAHLGDGKLSASQKPCRDSERHNHHRYQIHQILYVYIFHCLMGGGGCTN